MATEAPKSSKTMDTVVEVGIPMVLKKSSNRMSVIITAIKTIINSLNINSPGLKIPFLATSIIPLEKTAPIAIPRLATIKMVLKESALEPTAEFKKFTASLLTPTTKSAIAKNKRAMIIKKYISSIVFQDKVCKYPNSVYRMCYLKVMLFKNDYQIT